MNKQIYCLYVCALHLFSLSMQLANQPLLSLLTKYSNFCHRETSVVDGVQYVNV